MTVRSYVHFIDGAERPGASGETIRRHSPAHGAALADFAAGTAEDLDAAVRAAREAFEHGPWRQMAATQKSAILNAWGDLIAADLERLAVIEAEESGKPIRFARGEIEHSVSMLRYAAALGLQLHGEAFENVGPQALGLVSREPRGVVGMIVPWNFPMVTLFQKLPYALAAGCSAVVKPSELTSGTALEVAKLAIRAGLPKGVYNVVTGTGGVVGEAMTRHPEVDMISFTGSTKVGKAIARTCADSVKRVALELGGKAANVVFADADLDAAVDGVLFGYVLNQGEECVCGARLLIEESVADAFVSRLVERTRKIRTGLPLDEDADQAAMIHQAQFDQVMNYLEIGKAEGATVAVGGSRADQGALAKGYFVMPTIFTNVTPDMRIFREEIFGPVLTVTTFRTVDEAVALANDTVYGLGNGLWTKDLDKAILVSRRLRSGTVFVNTFLETSVQMPFGGFKQSGIGRENGIDGLLEYTEVKSTFIKLGERNAVLPHTV
ncbi:acyl-CoA reductase-like NAD-dependent aldehyde dehydrogenase [Paracoccus versutus]|uniref:Acyl-CoA reductase-like NAD-dependent aldehyde dehydrogenase n=1 Tax=Paracoccus versutus TaxID=34007 RepID=A0AAQ0KLY0_PARVE|nr:aldehyde dehydrogenase family protein [Paracoccus versutus]KGJ11156.1 sorbosone dehydrogenase [Paracoccus versutus]REG46202.1 acyl-CoA reductase-like NAD-dependent aldehyde dehydrogenase [Paracoccus versutus]